MTPARNSQENLRWFPSDRNTISLEAGEILFHQGDSADCMYVLLSGRLRAYSDDGQGREITHNTLGPGEILGELLLDGGARSASVQALTPAECLIVKETTLRALVHTRPEFTVHLLLKLMGRLRRASRMIENLALVPVRDRVVNLLEERGIPDGEVKRVPPIKQADIAADIGATREMVNVAIKQLIQSGYLHKDAKHRMTILKPLGGCK